MISFSRGAAVGPSLTHEEEKQFNEYSVLTDIFHPAMAHSFVQTTFVLTMLLQTKKKARKRYFIHNAIHHFSVSLSIF